MAETQADSPETSASVGERIVRASLVVSVAHMCLKMLGLVQAAVAGMYMLDNEFDAVYVFAFEGIIYSVYLIGEEVIGPTFLPVFMAEKDTHDEREAWLFANVVLTLQTMVLLAATLVIMCFPDQVIHLFTYWDQEADAAKIEQARFCLVWLAPSLLCLSLGSTTYMLLNGYKRFFLAAIGDASWKFCVIVALIVGMGLFKWDYRALIFGLLAGSVAKLLTHLGGLVRKLVYLRPSLALRRQAVRTMLLLMLPLIAGIVFAKVRDLYNNVTILSYLKTDGLMKANSFGRKLYLGISWLVPYAVSIAMFPFFCELVDKRDWQRLGSLLTGSCRMLLALFIPGCLLAAVVAMPAAVILFARGEISAGEGLIAGFSAACYFLVMPAFALEYVLMQGFFANRRMVSVTVIGVVSSLISVAISYLFIVQLGVWGADALAVVALGYVGSRCVKTLLLVVVLKRTVPMLPGRETLVFLLRLAIVGAVTGAVGYLAVAGVTATVPVQGSITGGAKLVIVVRLAIAGLLGTAAYFGAARLCGVREPFQMIEWGLSKVRRKLRRAA